MFRIARVRIRWISADQQASQGDLPAGSSSIGAHRLLNPENLRVRLRWVGFGSSYPGAQPVSRSVDSRSVLPAGPILATFHLPDRQVRLRWLGLGLSSLSRRSKWLLVLYAVLLVLLVMPRPAKNTNQSLQMEQVLSGDLITDNIPLGSETIQMIHSPLDIGQAKDVFDGDLETLMRGRDANPFVLDLEFPTPRPIKGIMMDFGRMDFTIRMQVYGPDSPKPVSYEGIYRQQPPIPHIDMDFANGPAQVTRIYMEIEQLDPPEEVHVHVREITFKE